MIFLLLFAASFSFVLCAHIMPFSLVVKLFGFEPLPLFFIFMILVIVGASIIPAEIPEKRFYQKVKF